MEATIKTKIPVYRDKFYNAYIDVPMSTLMLEAKGMARIESFMEMDKSIRQYIYKHRISHFMIDNTQAKIIMKEIEDCIVNDEVPALKRLGISKIGLVQSKDSFGKRSINRISEIIADGKLEIKIFDTREECSEWIANNAMAFAN